MKVNSGVTAPFLARRIVPLLLSFPFMLSMGCSGRGGTTIHAPALRPQEIAKLAFEQCDANGDGTIAGDELDKSASLKSALAQIDINQDQKITPDEITTCVESWLQSGVGITSVTCRVSLNRRPLVGATVTFEPEAFHGSSISTASGVSDERGAVRLITEDAQAMGLPDGMTLGFYKVRISKMQNNKELVPNKYNESTTLGRAVTSNDRLNNMEFQLRR